MESTSAYQLLSFPPSQRCGSGRIKLYPSKMQSVFAVCFWKDDFCANHVSREAILEKAAF